MAVVVISLMTEQDKDYCRVNGRRQNVYCEVLKAHNDSTSEIVRSYVLVDTCDGGILGSRAFWTFEV